MPGFGSLLKIRGIQKLEIRFSDAYWLSYLYGPVVDISKKMFTDKIRILKDPYTPADIIRREAKGITKRAESRMTFDGIWKPESRATRASKREQLKSLA